MVRAFLFVTAILVEPEFAVGSLELAGLDQSRVRYGDRVQRTIQIFNPEVEKFVQLGKSRKKDQNPAKHIAAATSAGEGADT